MEKKPQDDKTMHKSVEEFSVDTIEFGGLGSALEAVRLPFCKESKSEISPLLFGAVRIKSGESWKHIEYGAAIDIDPKDTALISTLVKRGDEHAKVLRGVMVWCEIAAPRYWWTEEVTYRIGSECLSSESTMHTIGKGGITIDNFAVPEEIKYMLKGKEKQIDTTPLYFGEPDKLESRILTLFGRDFEIWNNGDMYSLPYDICDSTGRKRHIEKAKISVGGTRQHQGYYMVRLGGREGGQISVHRLMALAFIDNPNNYPIVNHKDGNKWNCSISNLEWCTASENCQHAIDTGLNDPNDLHRRYLNYKSALKWTDEIISAWCTLRGEGKSCAEIAKMFGTRTALVSSYTATKMGRYAHKSPDAILFARAKMYEDTIEKINELAALYRETQDFDYVISIKEILPESFIQKRIVMFSYQTLRRIYFQRRNHRLPQWRKFCEWIETLPFAKELIMIDGNADRD